MVWKIGSKYCANFESISRPETNPRGSLVMGEYAFSWVHMKEGPRSNSQRNERNNKYQFLTSQGQEYINGKTSHSNEKPTHRGKE